MINEISSSGCHPRVGSCKWGHYAFIRGKGALRASEGLAPFDAVLLGKALTVPCTLGMVYRN